MIMENNNQPKRPPQILSPEVNRGGENLNDDNLQEQNNDTTTYDLRQAADEALEMYEQSKNTADTKDTGELIAFDDTMCLVFEIVGSTRILTIEVEQDIILGRSDSGDSHAVGIDLTEYGAYQLGLSRKHALIRRNGMQLEIQDVGSRNGTFVREKRLEPNVPYVVRNGDEVRFGNMIAKLRFAKKA